jgi:hypothetical protein
MLLTVGFLLTLSACGGGGGSTTAPTAPTDTTAPTVTSTTPVDSATSVARESTITATFNEDVFATTTDAASFTLAKSGAIDGTVTFEASTNVATYTPGSELAILATYTATLSTAITDLSGNPLAADYSWSFITAEGAWQAAELIETDNVGYAAFPKSRLIAAAMPSRCGNNPTVPVTTLGPTAFNKRHSLNLALNDKL